MRASRSFGQKIRLRLFNRGQIFSPKNFQLTLGFEKRAGKRAILKEKKKEIEEIDVKISTKGGILRSNGTKILRETYENCRTMMLSTNRNNDTIRLPSHSRLSLAFYSLFVVPSRIENCTILFHVSIYTYIYIYVY